MNTDYTYCTGHKCPIKTLCKRYIPRHLIQRLLVNVYWMDAEFDTKTDRCINFIDKDK